MPKFESEISALVAAVSFRRFVTRNFVRCPVEALTLSATVISDFACFLRDIYFAVQSKKVPQNLNIFNA